MPYQVSRGEIWMFEFSAPNKRRPVLVLSSDVFLRVVRQVTIADITSTMRGSPAEVVLGVEEGLKHDSVVNLINLSTVPQSQLKQYVGTVSPAKMGQVCRALNTALGC